MEQKQIIFLEGKKTILRPYDEESDLEAVTRWMNDQEISQFLGRFPVPLTREQEREEVRKLSASEENVYLMMVDKEKNHLIGAMGLHRINLPNRNAITGSIIGEKEYWGKGHGTDAKMVLLHYAFITLGLRRVGATVLSSNPRSLRCMEKCGYVVEGRRKEWIWRNGEYVDEILTVVTRETFMPLYEEWQKQ